MEFQSWEIMLFQNYVWFPQVACGAALHYSDLKSIDIHYIIVISSYMGCAPWGLGRPVQHALVTPLEVISKIFKTEPLLNR